MKMLTVARRALLALLCSCSFATATVLTPNFSDLWWNPSESGWGLNRSQQADVIFLTLFVYGPNSQAVWYSATLGIGRIEGGG